MPQICSINKLLFKPIFGALLKIRYWIEKHVQISHGFPFLKWCNTSQLVQWFVARAL